MAHAADLPLGLVRILSPPDGSPEDSCTIVHHTQNRLETFDALHSLFKQREVKFEGRYTIFHNDDKQLLIRVHGKGWAGTAEKIDAEIRAKAFQPVVEAFFLGKPIHRLGSDFLILNADTVDWLPHGSVREYSALEQARRFQGKLQECVIEKNPEEMAKAFQAYKESLSVR